jgi:SNF2 family DNA or RNA helicase
VIATEDWARKFAAWSDYDRAVHVGTHAAPIAPAGLPKRAALITSYETALDFRKLWHAHSHGGLLIIDEAHYAKNPTAKRTRALYGGYCRGFGGIIQPFDAVWPLSGTPTPNGDPRELWPHLKALRPFSFLNADTGKPYSYGEFAKHFCVLSEGGLGRKVIGVRNMSHLQAILNPFMLRRLPDACPDMPEISFELVPMRAGRLPTDLAFENFPELVDLLEAVIAGADAFDLDAQLQMQLATVRRLTGLLKIEATCRLIEEELRMRTVEKVVVFAYHVDVCEQIARRLRLYGAGLIHGGVSAKDRWRAIDDFQERDSRVLVGEILAASVNTTLTASHHVVFAETDWVPDNNLQAAYRCRRIGQKYPVQVRIIGISGSIDELLQQAAARKLRQLSAIYH